MRYIGNKESIVSCIVELLDQQGLLSENLVFFDAFAGTGSVADALKGKMKIEANDFLEWAATFTKGRLFANQCSFESLGFNPFDALNDSSERIEGFFYKNYSPGASKRMYFTEKNAGRIDFFRDQIEKWREAEVIGEKEYAFLLASLIESISTVSNVAGVYGAFLKKWDARAHKPLILTPVKSNKSDVLETNVNCARIEDLISEIDCDVLYLDPPYTQNQYGTQYHILQTLVLNDEPSISTITGSRPTGPMRSDWSKEVKAHILFDKILAQTKAKHIVLSYSSDGIMSKDFIEGCMKRYGEASSFLCRKVVYPRYKNFKTTRSSKHYEYLFYIKLKEKGDVVYESPLNYAGNKSRLFDEIKKHFPDEYDSIYDPFGGGFNFGINSPVSSVAYNDVNHLVAGLIESFYIRDTYEHIKAVKRLIKKFELQPSNKNAYNSIRAYYNNLPITKRTPEILFTVIMYGFNQQIRFNKKLEFNNPVGMRWFNDRLLEKFISFSRRIKELEVSFTNVSFEELQIPQSRNTLVYLDPPYKLTTGSYNDGKRGFKAWDNASENALFSLIDSLTKNAVPVMLSYVKEHKGVRNDAFNNWIESNENLTVIDLGEVNSIRIKRNEILIINY